MKRMRMLLTMLCALLLLGGCKKEPEISFDQFEITDELVLSPSGATIRGTYSFPVVIKGMKARVTEGDSQVGEYAAVLDGNRFTVEIGGLRPDTKYHYRYCVDYGAAEEGVIEARSFTTLSVTTVDDMPVVRTLEVLAIDSTTCRVKCEVTSGGSTPLVERGICWNTTGNPTMDDAVIQSDTAGLGEYMAYMERLASGKRYYVRAYARNATDVVLGNVLDFEMTALPGMPVNIQVSSNPEEGGTATGGGTYETGTTCTVQAVAAMGYHFVNWTENGNQVWSEPTYTFPVTVERNLVANFSAEAYVISVRIEPEEGGTATGAGGYSHGDTCTLVASPRMGYEFVEWTLGGNTVSTEAEYSFVVTSSATYTARFQVKNYTISVAANPEEGGSVSGGGVFSYGTSCTVHATAADGYAFEKWTDEGDEVSREADYAFVVTGNRHLVAHFMVLQPNEYNINVSANPTEGGQVTGGGIYQEGQECTVRATANAGYEFVSWTENGETVCGDAAYTFTVTRSRTLVANFTPQAPSEYTITVEADPQEGGTVAGGGTYQQGEQCEVRATAAEGYAFVGWTEDGDTLTQSATYSFIVTRDRSLVAHFSHLEQYVITATADPTNGGTVSGGGTYQQGQSCTLTATANAGYVFSKWTENGQEIEGANATYSFTVIGSRDLVAHFMLRTYTITTSVIPTTGGSATGGGTYNYGQNCTLTATANNGFTFIRWTTNGSAVSTQNPYSFNVTVSGSYVAQFQQQSYTISTNVNPSGSGSVTGGGTYTYGQTCTLTASPANGYIFSQWQDGNTQNPRTITVTGNATYTATFMQDNYVITVNSNPPAGGIISGGGAYHHGDVVTLTALANSGYFFDHWQDGNTDNPRTITVSGNATYTAYFNASPTWPNGVLPGLFTINVNGNQVLFSQGNLQYQASTNTWRFADNQWDYVGSQRPVGEAGFILPPVGTVGGSDNSNISPTYNGWIDLFCWGTSGYNHGAVSYQPWIAEGSSYNFYAYGNPTYSLCDSTGQADWGYNAISNGGNITNAWRTLTGGSDGEWKYIFDIRSTPSGIRYAKARVASVNGVILLPDDWSESYYDLNNTNQSDSDYSSNVISPSQWITLQSNGAVFLPAAGHRYGTELYNVDSGGYWSATVFTSGSVRSLNFNRLHIHPTNQNFRYYGYSVRLVCPVQ